MTALPPFSEQAIDLAGEPPFALGPLTVTPAARLVASAGWSHRLEPRAMQVLVALAQAAPEVVGRAALNRRVWGGRVMGEDAINRAVQMLRRLAQEAPAPAPFAIETIPRVGYRLTVASPAAELELLPTVDAPAARHGPIPTMALLAIATALLIAAAAYFRARSDRSDWSVASAAALGDLPPGADDAVLSPDGRRLAYRGQDAAGRDRIFVRAVTGDGAGAAISPPGFDARRPAWAAQGGTLAFEAYAPDRPCRLFVWRGTAQTRQVGACETARDPRLAWSADGASLLFGDSPGENAVVRITALGIADGKRSVLSSPPGDSMGDELPLALGDTVVFRRLFGWADEGWIARDQATGAERVLWRRQGLAGSIAAPLPDGTLAIAWTRAGKSGIDLLGPDGRNRTEPLTQGLVTGLSSAGDKLLVQTDQTESALVRAGGNGPEPILAQVRGRAVSPLLLPDGRLRVAVTSVGTARLWERGPDGALRPWGSLRAAHLAGLAPSPDGRSLAVMATDTAGREIVMLDAAGTPVFRWAPHARSLNPPAWNAAGDRLIVPVLDGAGWRLFALDPFTRRPPRDFGLPGFAVLLNDGAALYAVRAGEATGVRELWRLDPAPHRLPVDLTLHDIVNWRVLGGAVWLPDRSGPGAARLLLRDAASGRVLRRLPAPGLAGPGSGLGADRRGPVYVRVTRTAPAYTLLTLDRSSSR